MHLYSPRNGMVSYMTQHLVRFGLYHIDRTRRPKPLTYQVSFEPETVQEEREEGNEAVEEAGQA